MRRNAPMDAGRRYSLFKEQGARLCPKTQWPHDGPKRAWLRGTATKQYLVLRRGAVTKQTCPFRPTAGGWESPHLRRRNGSKGLLTQLSPLLLASEPIPSRREVIGVSDRALGVPARRHMTRFPFFLFQQRGLFHATSHHPRGLAADGDLKGIRRAGLGRTGSA